MLLKIIKEVKEKSKIKEDSQNDLGIQPNIPLGVIGYNLMDNSFKGKLKDFLKLNKYKEE